MSNKDAGTPHVEVPFAPTEITGRSSLRVMVRYTRIQDVKAPREAVFRYLTEVERLPAKFPDIFAKMEVVGTDGGSRLILCEEKWAGRHLKYVMKEKQYPPQRIEHTITEGSGKGSIETLGLEEIAGGTRITMTMDARGLAAALLGRLFRKQFEKEIGQIFSAYTQVIEAAD